MQLWILIFNFCLKFKMRTQLLYIDLFRKCDPVNKNVGSADRYLAVVNSIHGSGNEKQKSYTLVQWKREYDKDE